MKKLLISMAIIVLAFLFCELVVYAAEPINTMKTNTASELINMQSKAKTKIEKYHEKYGSETYGTAAYVLEIVRIYSIPLCFVGIAIGALYQYVLGTRRLDMKHRGFGLIIASITILVICQVLPLIFAIVVKGWGG